MLRDIIFFYNEAEKIKENEFIETLKLNKINILDVRKVSEFETQHIEGSANYPLGEIQENISKIKNEN